ncbi:MAG: hypothetical protein QOE53_113 [Pseudonocardiales bacterium]|jgi:hypothetical protein|nr:hypothetical protein [Pseudonocardiales bacterium]MDT4994315.1 hypothetical protein [Actinoplanes sp.]
MVAYPWFGWWPGVRRSVVIPDEMGSVEPVPESKSALSSRPSLVIY